MNHNLDELEAFARQFDTDKQAGQNGYLPLYVEYFKRQSVDRNAPLKILEIGTNKGSSLRMWAEYFPHAQVYGLDITRQYELPGMLDCDRIHTALVDQGDRQAMRDAFTEEFGLRYPLSDIAHPDYFDVIIDDGSHEQTHQQVSWGYLFMWLRPGGLYVLEDLITGENWWDANTYNRGRITPTRGIIQTFQQTGQLNSPAMEAHEIASIKNTCEYCEYRESSTLIFGGHHPQLAFMGKKNG